MKLYIFPGEKPCSLQILKSVLHTTMFFFSRLLKMSLSFDRIPLGQLVAGKQREKFLLIGTFFGEKNLFIVVARRETKLSVPRKGG